VDGRLGMLPHLRRVAVRLNCNEKGIVLSRHRRSQIVQGENATWLHTDTTLRRQRDSIRVGWRPSASASAAKEDYFGARHFKRSSVSIF
jgi:hypothetical protein